MTATLTSLGNLPDSAYYGNIISFGGDLYSARASAGAGLAGNLYKYSSGSWTNLGGSSVIDYGFMYLSVVGTDIYAIAQTVDQAYKWNGSGWTSLAINVAYPVNLGISTTLTDFGGVSYAWIRITQPGSTPQTGRLIRWSGSAWVSVTSEIEFFTDNIISFSGNLYILEKTTGKLFVLSGGSLVAVTSDAWNNSYTVSQFYSGMYIYSGELYLYRSQVNDSLHLGNLFKWNGSNAWIVQVPYSSPPSGGRFLFNVGGQFNVLRGDSGGDTWIFPDGNSNAIGPTASDINFWMGFAEIGSTVYLIGSSNSFSRSTLYTFDSGVTPLADIRFVVDKTSGVIPFYFRLTDVSDLSLYTDDLEYTRMWSITNIRTNMRNHLVSTSASINYCVSADSILNDTYTISLSAVIP